MKQLLLLLMLLLLIPSAFAQGATVKLSEPVLEDDVIIINITILDVTKFGAATFTVDYNPNSFELEELVAGDFLSPVTSSVILNTATGQGLVNARGFEGVSGSGTLAELRLKPEKKGTVQLEKMHIVDCDGMDIIYDKKSNIVTYPPDEPLPECVRDSDCGIDEKCISGKCVKIQFPSGPSSPSPKPPGPSGPAPPPEPECSSDETCPPDKECVENKCVEKEIVEKEKPGARGTLTRMMKTATNPYLLIPLLLAVLIVGSYYSYKHYKRVKRERAEKAAGKSLKMSGGGIVKAGAPGLRGSGAPKAKSQASSIKPQSAQKPDPTIDYIKSCRAKGFTDEKIKAELLKKDWSEKEIAKKMRKAKG